MKIWKNQQPPERAPGEHTPNAPVGEMTVEQALVMFQRGMRLPPEERFHALDGAIANFSRAIDDYHFRDGPAEAVAEAFAEVEGLTQAVINGS